MRGPIPILSSLTGLTHLSFANNQLDGPIPDWVGSFTDLQQLALGRNQLTGPVPSTLGGLTSLTELSLENNQLSGEIPPALGNLASLVLLYLHENQLTGEIPASLGNLANLKIARFASNTDAEGNPSLTGCVPGGLRFLVTADEFAPGVPVHDFIAVDANGDGDTDDPDDTPGPESAVLHAQHSGVQRRRDPRSILRQRHCSLHCLCGHHRGSYDGDGDVE